MAKALALAGIFYEDVGMMKVRDAARVEWSRYSLTLPLTSLPCSLPAVCPWRCVMRLCPHASPLATGPVALHDASLSPHVATGHWARCFA